MAFYNVLNSILHNVVMTKLSQKVWTGLGIFSLSLSARVHVFTLLCSSFIYNAETCFGQLRRDVLCLSQASHMCTKAVKA